MTSWEGWGWGLAEVGGEVVGFGLGVVSGVMV